VVKLVIFWCGWCTLHSLLITASVHQWIEKKGGLWLALYRPVYIGGACLSLGAVMWYTATVPQQFFAPPPWWLQALRCALLVYAAVLFVGGLRAYDMRTFLGLRQWRAYRQGRVMDALSALNTGGILAYVRHPWYSGGVALLWGLPGLSDVSLVTRLILSLYLVLGAFLEERKMHSRFGADYLAYCRRTPMFIPWRLGRGSQP